MLHHLPRQIGLLALVAVFLSPAAFSGELRQLADEPLAIMFAKEVNEHSVASYAQRVSKRMGIGNRLSKALSSQLEKVTTTKAKDPVTGQMFYLVQGLIPSLEQITFQSVVDEAEAKTLVESRRKMMGGEATLEEDNGVYRITRSSEHESEISADQKVEEYTREGPGYSSKLEIVERDGKRYQKQSWSFTQQYRYHDQFLYSNRAADFSAVKLPSAEEIYNSLSDGKDFGVKIYADRIPPGLRTMGWSLLNATLSTQLQQQDTEGDESAHARQTAGNWALSLLRSLMFDLDYGEGDGLLASGRRPIQAQFNLRPRRNSSLIKQLDEMGSGRSRFAPLLRDDAALSFHFCLALPDEGQETIAALARWIEAEAGINGLNPQEEAGYRSMAQALDDLAEEGTFEVILRVVHTKESGSVILTGIQLPDQVEQVNHMEAVVQHWARLSKDGEVEITQRHGRPLVHVQLSVDKDSPVRISDLWVAQRDGCLWMAAGGEHAHEMIRMASERCGQGGRAVHSRLLTAKLDLAHWMTFSKKDPTGLATFPEWVDTGEGARLLAFTSSFGNPDAPKPTPLLEKVMASRGDKEAWVTLDADKSGLSAALELGAPLADWFLARQIDAQEKQMEWREQQAKEQAEKAKKKAQETSG